MKNDNAQQGRMTLRQQREFHSIVLTALPVDMPWEVVNKWLKHPKKLAEALSITLMSGQCSLDWQIFYQKYFSISINLSQVQSQIQTPSYQEGFDRVIIVPKGITEDRVFQVCSEKFKIRKRTNQELSEVIDHNDRMSTETYAIRVRDCQEADKENKNISAEQAKEKDINGITLLERLIYELKYWDETEKHLDMANLTICSDSRCSDGAVPGVCCRGDGVCVRWCTPRGVGSDWRVRTVVSC